MGFSIKRVAGSILNIVYPPLCLHCQRRLPNRGPLFCPTCLEQLYLIETQERCRTCFTELYKGRCERCIKRPIVVQHQLAACEELGPAQSLKYAISIGRRECISAVASLMAYQWLGSKLSLPDYLIPLPIAFWQKHQHGFDMNLLLAQELGKIFSVSIRTAFKRRWDHRHFLSEGNFRFRFQLSQQGSLCDKHLLLISLMLDDDAFRLAGNELKAYFPARIDALAFTTYS